MSSEMSGEQMQAKIAAARRDAEGLKDKIKRKKDELADTSCKCSRIDSRNLLSAAKKWPTMNLELTGTHQYAELLKVILMLFLESA